MHPQLWPKKLRRLLSAADFTILLLVKPIEAVYHGMGKPHLEFFVSVGRLLMLAVIAVFLASSSGAVGMAIAHVISGVLGLGLAFCLLWLQLDSESRQQLLITLLPTRRASAQK